MSIYFIEAADGQTYELNATTSVSKTIIGKVTDNPVESGASLSDNYVNMPDTFSLEGVITDISNETSTLGLTRLSRTTGDVIENLSEIKRSKQTFTFYFGDAIAASLNCMFENIDFSQNRTNGNARGLNSFKVKARFRQVNFAEKAIQTNERDTAFEDKYQKEESSSQTTQSASDALDDLERRAKANISGDINNEILFPDEV